MKTIPNKSQPLWPTKRIPVSHLHPLNPICQTPLITTQPEKKIIVKIRALTPIHEAYTIAHKHCQACAQPLPLHTVPCKSWVYVAIGTSVGVAVSHCSGGWLAMTLVDRWFHHSSLPLLLQFFLHFFSITTFSHKKDPRMKKLDKLKLTGAPKKLPATLIWLWFDFCSLIFSCISSSIILHFTNRLRHF